MQFFARGNRITDLKVAVIGQAHNIPGISFVHHLFFLRHKSGRRREFHHPVETDMLIIHVSLEFSGTDFYEGDTGTVIRIHVSMYLEDKSGEILLIRIHHTLFSLYFAGRRGNIHKTVQQFFHPEIIQCGAKEYRCQFSGEIPVTVERRIDFGNQFHIVAQFLR